MLKPYYSTFSDAYSEILNGCFFTYPPVFLCQLAHFSVIPNLTRKMLI